MSVSVYAFTCGELEGEFSRVMVGAEGQVTMPVPVFLIEHPKGKVLFDSGLHPDCQHDPATRRAARRTVPDRHSARRGDQCAVRVNRP